MKRKSQREELQSVEGSQKAQLSKKLVTIQTDLELPPVRSAWHCPVPCMRGCGYQALTSPPACDRMAWAELRLQAPQQADLSEIERVLGELEFRQHSQRFTRVWEAMRSAAAL